MRNLISECATLRVSVASAPLDDAIGGDERLAAVGRHRLDVDDRALDFLATHDLRGLLDQEERRADVHVENLVEALFGGVENIAAVGDAGGVDEHVDPVEAAIRLGDHLAAVGDASKVRRDERRRAAGGLERLGDAVALGGVAPANDQPRRAALGEQAGDRFAQTL